ncbi:stage II sporulation protein M [Defluviimonas aestuarii]|uniref:stage II sporulation protein M n=1 Tax=Albidovulum aestuarii TaxID=1130726 RepID=UPI00249C229B|nr:stage II sporulation protein M [Defluviimonas aestuarii]MDI3336416.1 stage II sporulation protein M [Defluviimonas aestuarii]
MTGRGADQVDLIRSSRFRAEREAGWVELDRLITRTEKSGIVALSYEEAQSLASLYRQAMNSLSVARSISMDKALLSYLEALCARAYLVVYAPQESIRGAVARLFSRGIPRAVRRSALPLVVGFIAMFLGAVVGYLLYFQDPGWFFTFVPPGMSDGRVPGASVSYLRETLYETGGRDGETLGVFASFLFSHNTGIAIFIFALGVFATLPSFVLTFYNGLLLGSFFAMFAEAGLALDLFAWLSIHGVTELSAICVACAGGAQLGLAVLLPGNRTRRAALREAGRDAVKLIILAGLMLIVAAIVEGFLRQLVQGIGPRLLIGWGLGLVWLAWLTLAGRDPAPAPTPEPETDLP